MKKNKYTISWEEKYSTYMVDLFSYAALEYSNVISNDLDEYYSFIIDTDKVIVYNSELTQEKLNIEHGNYFLKPKHIDRLIKEYKKLIKEYNIFFRRISKLNLKNLSNKNLSAVLKDFFDFFIKLMAYYRSSRPEAEIGPMKKIKSVLYRYYTVDKINNVSSSIAATPKVHLIQREKRSWLDILNKKKLSEQHITEYILKYPSFYSNIYSFQKVIKLLKIRIKNDKKRIGELRKEVNNSRYFYKNIIKKQQKIYNKCENDKDLITYARMMQEFGWYRFEVKNIWAGSEIIFLFLFKDLAKRLNASLFDIFNYYTIEDLMNISKLSKKELNNRKKCLAILVKNKKRRTLSGNDGLKIYKGCKLSIEFSDVIKGTIAYKGLARGKAQIIYPTRIEDYKLFKKGNILVTTFTQPSMVPIMAKAAAIITCGGGITSHCAIVSRELKIPSVIGVQMATRILKNGDFIEVDGHKGVVRVLERKEY